jgi:hypothetical protein
MRAKPAPVKPNVRTNRYSKQALKELYKQRWHVELDIRNIKLNHGHGQTQLQDARHGCEGDMGLSAGL